MADIKKVIEEVMSLRAKKLRFASMYENGKFKPVSSYKMVYDAPQNQLETIYYWFLDFITNNINCTAEKIVDNFTSSPGSGHFAEMGQRATRMQEEGMKILGGLNQVIKSALNLVYDLKEFRMRLRHYDDYHSTDKRIKEAATLALKQVWLDSVDLPKRQTGSIHQMAAQLGYTTLREAFMIADTLEQVDKMAKDEDAAINEQVMRIVKARLKEFLDWTEYSERELRKRYSIEKSYLKSQVGTIKLYNGWVKPYLKAAEELRQKGFDNDAALVNAFSTTMFQLTLLVTGKKSYSSKNRKYHSIILVDFKYRGHLLQRANQKGDYAPAVGGRVDVTFDSYSLNNEEIKLIKDKLAEADLKDSLTLEGDYATEAIEELEQDLREFLGEEEVDKIQKVKKEEKKKNVDDINPFSALFDIFSGNWKKSTSQTPIKIIETKQIKSDNWKEKVYRGKAAEDAARSVYLVYDIYKKAHGMASTPQPFNNEGNIEDPETGLSEIWGIGQE